MSKLVKFCAQYSVRYYLDYSDTELIDCSTLIFTSLKTAFPFAIFNMSLTQGFINFFLNADSYRIQRWVISGKQTPFIQNQLRFTIAQTLGVPSEAALPTAISMSEWPHGTTSATKVKQLRTFLTLYWRAAPHFQLLLWTAAVIECFTSADGMVLWDTFWQLRILLWTQGTCNSPVMGSLCLGIPFQRVKSRTCL